MTAKQQENARKVGKLAERTGLSVRALHHYEEIGLLVPCGRTESGHRLYSDGDVLRLQQVASLRSLGFSLAEVKECLDGPSFSPGRVIGLHVARLKERMKLEKSLCERLEVVAARLAEGGRSGGDPTEGFVETVMEVTRMSENLERYYTPEQRELLERRRRELGEERIRQVAAEWPLLIEAVRAEMEAGTDPADERVRGLAERWMELVEEMTAGDAGIRRSLSEQWRQGESTQGIDPGLMSELIAYVSRAKAAGGGK